MAGITINLPGAPRTKKNSPVPTQIPVKDKNGRQLFFPSGQKKTRTIILPSEAYRKWFKDAMTYVPAIKTYCRREGIELPFKGPVHVKAIFYAENAVLGDLLGYEEAISDWLQEPRINLKVNPPKLTRDGAGIITDDKNIVSWDGSRLFIDRKDPRIEIEIRPVQEHLEMRTGMDVYEVEG